VVRRMAISSSSRGRSAAESRSNLVAPRRMASPRADPTGGVSG
jgi:hypothetical protein